ncbi:MAG: Hsp20/alpha crystallin family protein [Planctomycetales bacterium]|nr:Hsp20/alpha crystallin family protein [Planctomycetales bacterium]
MGNELVPVSINGTGRATTTFTPHVDVVECSDEIVLFADLPGVTTDNLDIRVHNGELAVAATIDARHHAGDWLMHEYEVGAFYRTFQLSDEIDASSISAELKNGELRIRLPKVERAKPIKINVNSG